MSLVRWKRWFRCLATAGSCSLLFTSSCARQPIQTLEESPENITVEGAFADWSPTANPFIGGYFALLDANSNEVFFSEIKTSHFKIEKVPSQGKYYGLLIGPDYQVRGTLRKLSTDGSMTYSVFKTGTTAGQLGTLVVSGDMIESSQQSDLEFQTSIGATKEKKAFTNEFSTNFVFNPDIDSDGIPNVIDDDVDGDDFTNIIDGKSYGNNSIADSKIPWQYNYGYGIPRTGYLKCDQLKSPVAGSEKYNFEFWCTLKLPANFAEKVTLKSNGVSVEMFDDGDTVHKDQSAGDGIWTARFTFDEKKTLFPKQLIVASVTLKSGSSKSYLTQLGPEFPYAVEFKTDEAKAPLITFKQSLLEASCVIKNWKKKDSFPKGLTLEVLLLDPDDESLIKVFSMPLYSAGEAYQEGSNHAVFTISETNLENLSLSKKSYKFKARVIAPAALPGLVGSGTESAVTTALPYPSLTLAP